MKKRIGSLLMALVLALSLAPATVWAADGATEVGTFEELKQAVSGEATDIVVTQDIELTERLTVAAGITIRSQEGSVFTLKRSESFTPASDNTDYRFKLDDGADLTFRNIILDGNKEAGQAKNGFFRVSSTNAKLTLGQGATIQNCSAINGGSAISLVRGSVVMEQGSAIKDCTNTSKGGAIYIYREPQGSWDKDAATLTMNGATISGCSVADTYGRATGGAIYAYGRVTMDIQDSTIKNNTATGNGGAIYGETSKNSGDIVLNLSGTTITGNTSQQLGGGVYFAGTTFTVSGVTNITGNTGNTGKGSSNNVYLAAGKTINGSGLEAGSKVGISGANIPSTLVTGYDDDNETGYFTADRTDTKLKATNGALELVGKDDHTHCICGRTDCQETGTGHRKITCKGVSSLDMVKTKGSYYLLNDVTLTKTWKAPSGITLCLNGFSIQGAARTAALTLSTYGSTFNLTDCGSTGKVTSTPYGSEGNRHDSSGVVVAKDVTFNLYNGSICDLSLDAYQNDLLAGAVEVNGTFNMYSGSIKDNQGDALQPSSTKPYTGGVLVNSTGVFNLYGGEISGNYSSNKEATWAVAYNGGAVNVNGGKFYMYGGVIKNNTAGTSKSLSNGGAVYIGAGGKFTMTGGEISGNTATRNGGGVAVYNGAFTMSGNAKISNNIAKQDYNAVEHLGGGVYVGASGKFTMSGDTVISGNLAHSGYADSNAQGGGVYVASGGTFTMNDNASIKSNTMKEQYTNTAKSVRGGVFVGGTLNLGGGSIEDNTAVYEGGGLYLDTKGTVNLGTGTIIVRNNTSEKTTGHNLYLPGEKKLIAPAAPADGSSITLSLPLARIQKAEGTAVITNSGKDIRNGDSRFAFEAEKITLVRDGDGDDVLARIPAHTHDGITYTPVYSLAEIPSNATGSYYLLQDAKMSGAVTVGANNTVNVCLNGHKSEPIYFKNSGTLNITDCKHGTATPGYITGYSYNSGGSYNIENASGSTLNLTNVTVKEKTGSTFISATGATVNISGCEYYDSESGFLVASTGSKVTVTDSTFKNNTMRAPTLWFTAEGATTGSFTVKDCTFTGNANNTQNVNYETSRGCAINSGCPGTTLIENCTITKNLSHGDGGGIYLYGKGTATIKNTTVEDNESQWHGGGITVDSANAPVFTGKVVVQNNKSRIPYNAYYQDMTTVVDCNVMIIGYTGSRCAITTDSGFNAGASKIGLSAWDIPSLVVSGNTSTKGFFVDDKDCFVLRPTTSTSGPLLTSGNTGLELWHNGKGHTHCVCGTGENTADSTHTHEKLNWIGVTELKDLPEGNYYLLRGYSEAWAPTKDINLCLNGLGISSTAGDNAIIDVDDSNKVAVTDCNESKPGTITGSGWYARGVYVTSGSTFTLWNGKLTGLYDMSGSSSYNIQNGGGVWMKGGKFVMNGGSISARSTNGHGGVVYMYSGTFIMNDGSLSGKALNGSGGVVYAYSGRFEMNGGTITGKAAETEKDNGSRGWAGHGGAVYNDGATVIINGGTITGSSAVEGGGIYADGSTLTIGKANITDNTAAKGGGGIYAYNSALTIDGASITGNNGGESLGGGIYISEAKGNGTASDPYIPAVIQNATIENNTAKCGGGISTSGPVKISDTTITGNTATTLKNWGGGGVNARIIPKSSRGNGWVFELSGKMNITGNNAEGVVNNLYFPEVTAGTMLPSVTGLTAGSTIGVTTEVKPLKDGGTIAPVYITGDATSKDYFTSDEGYEVKLDADKNQLYIIAESYSVSVTLGENMESTGTLTQDLLKGAAMTDAVITAKDGYYFPENYGFTQDGITVTRDSLTQITVSGTPTAEDVVLTLPAATAKTTPAAPGGLQGVAPSTWGAVDGKISGTKATMEWATSPNSETWTSCTEGTTTVGGQGTYYVRVKATDISYTSDAAAVTVPKYLKAISFPAPVLTYTYDGNEHTLLVPGEGYTVSGDTKAINAGTYTATVNLNTDRYQWSSTVTDNTISWTVSKTAARAEDFTFAAPENLIWDGHAKAATITLNAPLTLGGCMTSLVYKQGDKVVENPTDPGTYQVYLVISGDGNFAPTDGLTAATWTFTIQHPTDHVWGKWQHDDTQHWRYCTVPGCTAEERENHTTDTPATCTTQAVCTVCESPYGEMDAHNHPAAKVTSTAATAPTCGSKGNQAYSYCADCHKYFKDGDKNLYDDATHFDIAALTHRSATKTAAVAPTCEVGGNLAYWYCADCGNYYADKDGKLDSTVAYNSNASFLLNALGHDFSGQPYKTSATDHWQVCKHDGCTQETAHQAHSGHEATCVAESKCQVCGYKLADKAPNNHLLAQKTEAKAPTCTQPGNDAYWHCTDCGKYFADKNGDMDTSKAYDTNDRFLKSALDHDFTEKLVDDAHLKSAATCTASAVYYYDCSRCDTHSTADTYSYGDPLGHNFTEKLVDDAHLKSAATCTEAAVYYYDCSRCDMHSADKTFTDGDPLGHSYTKEDTGADHLKSAATCTEDAVYYKSCERCGKNGTETFIAADTALGHSYTREDTGAAHLKSAATCTEDAVYYKSCARCAENGSETFTAAGTALGHDFAGQPYLHDETGHWQTCKRDGCDVTSTAEKHISDEGKITKEPTAAVEGEKTFTCTVCGLVLRTEPVAKLAPTIVEGANGKHQTGGNTDLTFRSDASFEDFLSVSVDGKVLDKNQYTLREGSILVTLKADYLSTLSVGQHTLGVTSASGTAETVFTVTAAPAVVPTGDTAGLTLWVSLAALCGLGTLVVVSRKKRENG